jgi:hypothetical protein
MFADSKKLLGAARKHIIASEEKYEPEQTNHYNDVHQ